MPSIPVDSFRICIIPRHRKNEIAYTVVSLGYGKVFPIELIPFLNAHSLEDLLVFLVILHMAGLWKIRRFGIPGLMGTILRDATKYFLVIFTSHFVLVMTLIFARVSSMHYFANRDDPKRFLQPSLQLLPVA